MHSLYIHKPNSGSGINDHPLHKLPKAIAINNLTISVDLKSALEEDKIRIEGTELYRRAGSGKNENDSHIFHF